MNKKVRLEIISADNPFSREQLQVDKVKVLSSLNEDKNEVVYFKTRFPNTTTFGNLVQIHDERALTEIYEKLSTDEDVLLKIARPQVFFKKFLCTDDMQHYLFANDCRVWILQEPASEGLIKTAELFAERKEDHTWIVEARWVGTQTIRHLDYIFYVTTK